jgi:hypothetical protein
LQITQEKKHMVNQDIDSVLKNLQGGNRLRKRDLDDDVEIDQIANSLIEKMREAAFNDLEFNKKNLPALAKLKLLQSVSDAFTKFFLA